MPTKSDQNAPGPPPSVREKAIKGVFWSAVQNWGSNLSATVVFLILANLLDPAAFGLVGYAAAILAVLAIFQRQGFAQAIIQREQVLKGHRDSAFWMSAAGGVVLAAATFASAGVIAAATDKPLLTDVLRALSAVLIIDALGNVPQALLRRELAFRSLALRSLIASLVGGVVGVALALGGGGVWALVGQRLASSVSGTITLWFASRWRPGLSVSRRHFKDLFGFGAYTMGNETVGVLNRQSAPLLIGTFLGDAALGHYRIGFRLLQIMTQLFNNTIQNVTLPTLSRIQHDHSQVRASLLTATRLTGFVAFPAFLGAAILAPEIIFGLCGEKWAASIPVMRILALVGIVQSVSFFSTPTIMACGKPSWAFGLSLTNGITNMIFVAAAIPWGIVAVAAAFTTRAYLYAPLPLLVVRRLIGLELTSYFRQFVPPLIASAVMAPAVWGTRRLLADMLTTRPLLAVATASGIATYTLAMWLLWPDRLKQVAEYVRVALPRAKAV